MERLEKLVSFLKNVKGPLVLNRKDLFLELLNSEKISNYLQNLLDIFQSLKEKFKPAVPRKRGRPKKKPMDDQDIEIIGLNELMDQKLGPINQWLRLRLNILTKQERFVIIILVLMLKMY